MPPGAYDDTMPRRLLCLHGHFYQPPRENPWIEEIEVQDSAEPFHDWNRRIAAECYGPNGAARLKVAGDRIADILNNYLHLSFNFGPTLPSIYALVLEARRSRSHIVHRISRLTSPRLPACVALAVQALTSCRSDSCSLAAQMGGLP